MNDNKKVYNIFPIPIYEVFLPEDIVSKNFLQAVNSWSNFGSSYGKKSTDTYVLDNLECDELKKEILKHTLVYAQDVLNWKLDSLKLLQSWISLKSLHDEHHSHYHPNSAISGIYYFDDHDSDQGSLIFQRNPVICQLITQFSPDFNNTVTDDTVYPWSQFIIHPRKNMLIIFPSWVHHSVQTNHSSNERKSLAFNVIPTGIFGSNELTTEMKIN
jgi:uncharacterized protein (TIGR02466 family)